MILNEKKQENIQEDLIKELESYLKKIVKESYVPKEYDPKEFIEYRLINRVYENLLDTKEFLKSDILNDCLKFYLDEITYRITGEGISDLIKELFLFVDLYNNENTTETEINNVLSQIEYSADAKSIADEIKEFHTSFFAESFIEFFETLKKSILQSSFESSISKERMLGKIKTTSLDPLDLYENLYLKIKNCSLYKEEEFFYLAIIFESFRKNIEEKRINTRVASDMFVAELKDYLRYKYQSKNIAKEVQKLLLETNISLNDINSVLKAFEHNPLDIKKSEVDFFSSLPPLKIPDRKDSTEVDLETEKIDISKEETSKVWGTQASGILLISEPDTFTKSNRFVLLQKRASWVSGGAGKWAPPGGAFNPRKLKGEEYSLAEKVILQDLGLEIESINSIQYEKSYKTNEVPLKLDPSNKEHLQLFLASAIQEFKEEVGIDLNSVGDYTITNIVVTKKDDWNYVTFVISVTPQQKDTIQANFINDSESDATMWVPIEDILFKEGPGSNLWDVAINDNIISIIKKQGAGIIDVYKKSKVTNDDIPDRQSILKILEFLRSLSSSEDDLNKMMDTYDRLKIDKNDLYKVLIAMGIHTDGKKGLRVLRNIENLKSETINKKIHEILNLNITSFLSNIFDNSNVVNRRIELKDIVLSSRIIRRFNSLKFDESKAQIVYRGITIDDTKENLDMLLSLIQPGSQYLLGRNVSTTKSPGMAQKFASGLSVVYKIQIPDELATSLEKISNYPSENEVLISGPIRVDSFILEYNNVKIGANYFKGELDDSNMELVKKLVKYCETVGGSLAASINCTLLRE